MTGWSSRVNRGRGGPLLTLVAWLLLAAPAHATQVEATDVPCPMDGGTVRVYRLIARNSIGGWDSDGARYASGGQFRDYAVSTCANGLSLLGADLGLGLPPSLQAKVKPVMDEIQEELAGRDPAALPAWERHAHAARYYRALGRPWTEAQLWLSASWLVRDVGVGLFQGLDGPVMARLVLVQGEAELAKDLTPEARKQVTFNLAVVAHRGGYPELRNKYLAATEALPLTGDERERVGRLRWAAATEVAYQDRAIDALQRAMGELTADLRWSAAYQLAELLRRRGRPDQARPLFQTVADGEGPEDIRKLAAYFGAELDGQEPWEKDRFRSLSGLPTSEPQK